MKKSKLLLLGLIALMLIGGLVLASCGDDLPCRGSCGTIVRDCYDHSCLGTSARCRCKEMQENNKSFIIKISEVPDTDSEQ